MVFIVWDFRSLGLLFFINLGDNMIELNKRYGCLTVLDMGEEYKTTEEYLECIEEYRILKEKCKHLLDEYESYDKQLKDNPSLKELIDGRTPESREEREFLDGYKAFQATLHYDPYYEQFYEIQFKARPHYKCVCDCGRIHYYNDKTLLSKPKFCKRPKKIADVLCSYSYKAINANDRQRAKLMGNESLILWSKPRKELYDKMYITKEEYEIDKSLPSEEYCELYNEDKRKKMKDK